MSRMHHFASCTRTFISNKLRHHRVIFFPPPVVTSRFEGVRPRISGVSGVRCDAGWLMNYLPSSPDCRVGPLSPEEGRAISRIIHLPLLGASCQFEAVGSAGYACPVRLVGWLFGRVIFWNDFWKSLVWRLIAWLLGNVVVQWDDYLAKG